ncbi:hypothetical protein Q1695_000369 [Nippostrongylus brasiliensis]|nr:hypothetical protein Q1695_000369 [Nippostrongylus brasiliensis]
MFPLRSGLSLFQHESADVFSATFPLWGHLMFPREPITVGATIPVPVSLPTELTVTVNDRAVHEPQTLIKLKPIDSSQVPPSPVEPNDRVPGLMLISMQFGSMKFAVVLCTKEEGFTKGSNLKLPASWKRLIRVENSTANVEDDVVRRAIRCGDEIVLRRSSPSTPPSTVDIDKKEPVDLSIDMKSSSETVADFASTNGGGFSCERCGKVFSYSYYRDKHLKYTRCVDNGDRKFPCPICPRSFEKKDRLRIHILHVHENHRPHLCSICGKAFSQSSSLNKHLRVHSGERPYTCPFCPKAFTASSILRTHMRQHSGEKPFKCAHCGKPFASHAAHDSHVRRNHGAPKS